jgi:hypothetical protein
VIASRSAVDVEGRGRRAATASRGEAPRAAAGDGDGDGDGDDDGAELDAPPRADTAGASSTISSSIGRADRGAGARGTTPYSSAAIAACAAIDPRKTPRFTASILLRSSPIRRPALLTATDRVRSARVAWGFPL